MSTTLRRDSRSADPLVAMGLALAEKLAASGQQTKSNMLAHALHELLDGQDEAAKSLRLAMQIHLARVSNGADLPARAQSAEMLGTEAAAKLMGCSRPYVAMLIDAGKLAGAVKSEGGHRKVPAASVLEWIEAARMAAASDTDYRKAAVEAGMYATADKVYVKASARRRNSES